MADHGDNPLAAHLASADETCPSCGYSLHGCPSDRCPECGVKLRLTVVTAQATLNPWWLSGIFGVGLSVCISLLFLVMSANAVVRELKYLPRIGRVGSPGPPTQTMPLHWERIFAMITLCVLSLFVLAWLIASRRRFTMQSGKWQAIVGLCCALSPLVVMALVAFVIMAI